MSFGAIEKELNTEQAKEIIDSVLNVGYCASVVIDKSTFEILYENEKAEELLRKKAGCACHDILCSRETPCMDCPIMTMSGPVIKDRYIELLDSKVKIQYSNIKWFDGKDVVLVVLLEIDKQKNEQAKSYAQMVEQGLAEDKRQTDPLTRIPNYAKFYTCLENALKYNTDKNYAVVVFDIDKFKSINDLYGLSQGDAALQVIADALREQFSLEENYARLHSDVFAFYMPYEKKGDIIRVIEKLRKRIGTNEFEFGIHTTFGIYLAQDKSVPVNLMCDRARMAGKTIKDNIMKFCSFYDEQYREEMLKTNEIERDMYGALARREFQMYLQPKYKLDSGELCGAEVLCRWLHPQKGLIPPNDFIPLFEKNGFILKLDEYMWEQACKTIRNWLDEGRTPVPLSVNISRYHIQHNDLEHIFTELLRKYNLTADMLTLEITESLFLDKPEQLNQVLKRLQGLGFKLEVDDFGSGFSSLNLIRNITVDTIKIDKDFLDSEIATEKGKIVVNHTISMAKDLQLQVIAEGVETKEHVDFLKNSRCDIAQGFYFARPMPLEQFNDLGF